MERQTKELVSFSPPEAVSGDFEEAEAKITLKIDFFGNRLREDAARASKRIT